MERDPNERETMWREIPWRGRPCGGRFIERDHMSHIPERDKDTHTHTHTHTHTLHMQRDPMKGERPCEDMSLWRNPSPVDKQAECSHMYELRQKSA